MRRRSTMTTVLSLLLIIAIIVVYRLYLSSNNHTSPTGSGTSRTAVPTISGKEPNWGVQAKTSGCKVNGALPDSACTPGALLNVTAKDICVPGYARAARNVPQSIKNKAYDEYGIKTHKAGQYEVDHLVSLQLGGSNDIANLWPEIATPHPGFHEKDGVENYLHAQVCKGAITLRQAQIEIATNWLAVYDKTSRDSEKPSNINDGNP